MAATTTSIFKTQTSIFFLILFFTTFVAAADHQPEPEVFGKYISPSSLGLHYKHEKLSHLHFYFHDTVGKYATAVRVAGPPPPTNNSFPFFGNVYVIDDPLTINPDIKSKTVGKAQGMYAYASQTDISLLMVINFVFTEGKYNGSTLSVLARNEIVLSVREMPVVGGSGLFRYARGYALAKTHSMNEVTAAVEYNVFVFHY